jgi:uncharacterized metal-binding protein
VLLALSALAGRTPKEAIGLKDEEKIRIGEFESMCSPIAQAMVLNEGGTDLNISHVFACEKFMTIFSFLFGAGIVFFSRLWLRCFRFSPAEGPGGP